MPARTTRGRLVRRLALAALTGTTAGGPAVAQSPPKPLPTNLAATSTPAEPEKRVVAYVYGNVPVYREELVDYLIARGGAEKLELVVNKRIIQHECDKRGVGVTKEEIDSGLGEDLAEIGAKKEEFVGVILPKYGKTLYEWRQDVIRPRIALGKMVQGEVGVTAEELNAAFDRKYGEKRQARVIIWPAGSPPTAEQAAAIRGSDLEFDRAARAQADRKMADAGGNITPVGRYLEGEDPTAVKVLFDLKVGETSGVFQVRTGYMCIKCVGVIPPNAGVNAEAVRPAIEKEVRDRKVSERIPEFFKGLKAAAAPTLLLRPLPGGGVAVPPGVDPRVVATVTLDGRLVPITREELGDFLIARGGADKLELVVNKRILETEARERKVEATPEEVDAAYADLLSGAGIDRKDFEATILPKKKLTLAEYREDVVKPDVVLNKLVGGRVAVTPDDLRKAHERQFGERRACEIVIWPKGQEKAAIKEWQAIRQAPDPDAEWARVARSQADPNLAAAAGRIAPVGRHVEADDPVVEKVVFGLRPGEMSQLLQTRTGTMCVKCVGVVPAQNVPLEQVKAQLERDEFKKKVVREVPKFFAELKQRANPTLLLTDGPRADDYEQSVRALANEAIHQAGAKQAAGPKK